MDRSKQIRSDILGNFFKDNGRMPTEKELSDLLFKQSEYGPVSKPMVPLYSAKSLAEYTREDLLKKEREYAEHRHTIEIVLESFYRSANSLVFQLNKRYIPKHKSILRVIDRRYESNECFIRYDDSPDEDWLVLIYLEDSDAKKGKIVVENKANPDKHETKSFETKEIFTYSDYLVDSMTAHIDRERQKKAS